MAIPFRDLRDTAPIGTLGYLKFSDEPVGSGIRAALFLVNARVEPMDFTFTRVDVHGSVLWRPGEARRQAVVSLLKVLFAAASRSPDLLLALADELPARVLVDDLEVRIPACRVGGAAQNLQAVAETAESLPGGRDLFWVGQVPGPEQQARLLLDQTIAGGLLIEPFERALAGLEQAFQET